MIQSDIITEGKRKNRGLTKEVLDLKKNEKRMKQILDVREPICIDADIL